jgi:hypothetical protein
LTITVDETPVELECQVGVGRTFVDAFDAAKAVAS